MGDVSDGRHHRSSRTLLVLNETALYDGPRFRHRGLLIDTSDHFLPVDIIKDHIDAMSMVKLNVLHWRMNGDASWPFVSESVPELSVAGAFSLGRRYHAKSIDEVVSYAKHRGIRVVVELDTPANTGASIGKSHPELVVNCDDDHHSGPVLNPATNATYDMLWEVVRDFGRVFGDRAMHFGGDGMDRLACWASSLAVMETFPDVHAALTSHTRRMMAFAAAMGKVPIVYDGLWKAQQRVRAREEGVLPPDTVVQVLGPDGAQWKETVDELTNGGKRVVLSSPWHVDEAGMSGSWSAWWMTEPMDAFGRRASLEQQDLVLGGEVVVRSQLIDTTNTISRTWPLAATTAERYVQVFLVVLPVRLDARTLLPSHPHTRLLSHPHTCIPAYPLTLALATSFPRLWSQDDALVDVADAEQRLFRLRCRMVARGISAAPISKNWGACPFVEEEDEEEEMEEMEEMEIEVLYVT